MGGREGEGREERREDGGSEEEVIHVHVSEGEMTDSTVYMYMSVHVICLFFLSFSSFLLLSFHL